MAVSLSSCPVNCSRNSQSDTPDGDTEADASSRNPPYRRHYPRDAMLQRGLRRRPCLPVCLCLLQAVIVSKWLNGSSWVFGMYASSSSPALRYSWRNSSRPIGLYPKITVGSTSLRNFVLKSGLGKFRLSTGQYFCLSKNALADPRNVPSWYVLSMLPSELSFNYRPPNGSPLIDVAVVW